MIGRKDAPSSTYQRRSPFADRRTLSPEKGKLLLLAALLLVFTGIAMADHEQKRMIAEQNRYDSSDPIDVASVYGPSTLFGSKGNVYQNQPTQRYESLREFDNAVTVEEATPLSYSAALMGAAEAARGTHTLSHRNDSSPPVAKEDSAAKKEATERPASPIEKVATEAVPIGATTAIKNSFRVAPPRRSAAKKRLYRRNSKILTVQTLTRHRYRQRPIAVESTTETVYATVYPRRRHTVLGTAGKIISAPVKFLLSPFKRKEYYD